VVRPWVAAGLLAVMVGGGAEGAERAAAPPAVLRVVTLNLLHGGPLSGWVGDGDALERRLDLVTAELAALRPDVVALQEASVGWGRGNVAHRLAERLGLHVAYAPTTERALRIRALGWLIVRAMNFNEGPALLSRFPIQAQVVHDLPRCAHWFDPRVALEATLATPWGPLRAVSTHVSRDDCQLRRLREIVGAAPGPLPALVMGDLNASETLPAIGELTAAGWVDAFRAAQPGLPGFTVWQRPGAPQPTVFRRVDYVFVVPSRACAARVVASRVVLDTPGREPDGGTLWPSDHYGVLADLDLRCPSSLSPPATRPQGGLVGGSG